MATADVVEEFKVDGKTAIITGAGSGINLAFAALLLRKNCNVVIADLSLRPEGQSLVDKHAEEQSGQGRAVFVRTDVVSWRDLIDMFDFAYETFGEVDIVCPGAGVFEPPWSNFWNPPGSAKSKDAIQGGADGIGHYALLDINLVHPIRTTQIAIDRWLHPSDGRDKVTAYKPKRIIHISSIAGQAPSFPAPMYAASKAGLSSFVRSMEQLEDIGIRVNAVAPGIIKTPLWLEHPEKLSWLNQEKDTWLEPEEVANAMLRCLEDDSVGPGVVLEVLKNMTRKVGWRMDPGPSSKDGATVSNALLVRQGVFETLLGDKPHE